MSAKQKFYLTTPIYYTNGLPHIGHTYTTVVADVIRRYKRMRGYEVVMTTGTDEHGVNVERAAKKAGVPESEFVAKMADAWRALWDELGTARRRIRAHHRSSATCAPCNGSSNSSAKTATSTKAITPANTASTTTLS